MGKQRFVVKIENAVVCPMVTSVFRHEHINNVGHCEEPSTLQLRLVGDGSECRSFISHHGEISDLQHLLVYMPA